MAAAPANLRPERAAAREPQARPGRPSVMRSPLRPLVASVLGATVVVLSSSPVGGLSCVGPTIEHTTGTLDRGATLRVEGTWWGELDGSYDECTMDRPVEDITVVVVQDGSEHPLATVDADEDFGFVIEVPLPADLEPGLADVRSRGGSFPSSYDASRERLMVSAAPPVAPAPTSTTTAPVTTAPAATAATPAGDEVAAEGEGKDGDGNGRSVIGVVVVVGVAAALVVAVAVLFARQTRRPAPSDRP